MGRVRATTYLQVRPSYSPWDRDHSKPTGAQVVRATQSSPDDRQIPGTVLVKITVELPTSAFQPLEPEALVVVPDEMVSARSQITVEAQE